MSNTLKHIYSLVSKANQYNYQESAHGHSEVILNITLCNDSYDDLTFLNDMDIILEPTNISDLSFNNALDVKLQVGTNVYNDQYHLLSDCIQTNTNLDSEWLTLHPKPHYNYDKSYLSNDNFKLIDSIQKIWKFLYQNADDQKDPSEIFYFTNIKIDIYFTSDKVKISSYKLECIDEFFEFFNDELYIDQKHSVLKNILTEKLEHIEPANRFTYILEHFEQFYTSIKTTYDMFIQGFSYDSFLKNIEKHKIEWIERINKSLSSIQTQLLGIPISIIIATRFSFANSNTFEFNNYITFGAIYIYMFLFLLLINNQYKTLLDTKLEVDSSIKDAPGSLESKLLKGYEKVNQQICYQKKVLSFLGVLAIAILILDILAFWYFEFQIIVV